MAFTGEHLHDLTEHERRDWLRLIRTPQIGPATFRQLLRRFGNAADAIAALPDLQGKARQKFSVPAEQIVLGEIETAEHLNARHIALCEPDYPAALRAVPDAPPVICVCGDPALLQRPAVAIVGARNASAAGRKIAAQLATGLGEAEIVVVSGLARGIDGAAHEASLESGTIAVVAGGVDVIYPPEHEELTRRIAGRGVLVSEMPPGYRPTGRDFPRRNRIISGLSHGVIVVEAARKSGTLITARFALEQGRDVFAVPGSPLDPRSQGTNRLIRDGALLIEDAADVLDSLNFAYPPPATDADLLLFEPAEDLAPHDLACAGEEVKSLLSFTPTHRDDLIRASSLSAHELNQVLLELVLGGDADEHTGGRYALAPVSRPG